MAEKQGIKIITQNKKAWHDYFVDEKYEAGIELYGTEVKSIRGGGINLKDSYCHVQDGELYAYSYRDPSPEASLEKYRKSGDCRNNISGSAVYERIVRKH